MRVLIIGYGKMGRIHGQHLTELGVRWSYCDPHVPGDMGMDCLRFCTHVVVATPIETHFAVYQSLGSFPGRILIEKPVVTRREHLFVLDDLRVSAGMCERFNPAVVEARRLFPKVEQLSFTRNGPAVSLIDTAIHDLDLYCWLRGLSSPPQNFSDSLYSFTWQASVKPKREMLLNGFRVDLLNRTIGGTRVPNADEWPVRAELRAFLAGERVAARVAHEWLVSLLERSGVRA